MKLRRARRLLSPCRMTTQKKLAGVLLDVDGTLLDSNDAHALSWVEALAEHGFDVPFDRVRPLIGMGGDKLMQTLVGMDDTSEEGQKISARRRAIFMKEHLPSLRPTPGARELLLRLREDSLRLIVATSATGEELESLLRQAEVLDVVEDAASSDDADRSKPDPDIVRAAAERSGLRPGRLLMLGDTPYDIEAARRAGIETVAVTCGGWSADTLHGAAAVYETPQAILNDYANSPLSPAGP